MTVLFLLFLSGLVAYNYGASKVFFKAIELSDRGRYRLSGFAHEAVIIGFPFSVFSTVSRCIISLDAGKGYTDRVTLSLKRYVVLKGVPVAGTWKPVAVDLFAPLCIFAFGFFSSMAAALSVLRRAAMTARSLAGTFLTGALFIAWASLASDGSLAMLGLASVRASVSFQAAAIVTAFWSMFGVVLLILAWSSIRASFRSGPASADETEQAAVTVDSQAEVIDIDGCQVDTEDAVLAVKTSRHPCSAGRKEA